MITATLPAHEIDAPSLFEAVAHEVGEIVVVPSLPADDPEKLTPLVLFVDSEDWTPEVVEALVAGAQWWLWSGEHRSLRLVGPDKKYLVFTRGSKVGRYRIHHEHDGSYCLHCGEVSGG